MTISSKLLEELRAEYGDIFTIEIGGQEYAYRMLTINEINHTKTFTDEAEAEDYYVEQAVVYPSPLNLNKIKAGYVTQLAEAVMIVSGIIDLDSVQQYLEHSRQTISTEVISNMQAYIIAAMPAYKREDFDHLNMKQLIDKLTFAEQILTLQQAIIGLETEGVKIRLVPLDREEEEIQPQPTKKVDKEELLRRVRQKERATSTAYSRDPEVAKRLEETDEDLLLKMAGETDSRDPIAKKLFGG